MREQRQAILIAGPTASGKSAFALEQAQQNNAIICNADSMQVYDLLRIITARPAPEDMSDVQHLLYGFVPPSDRFSTGAWLEAVKRVITDQQLDRPIVFVGGTGLYFEALLKGVATVPPIPQSVVEQVEGEVSGLDRSGRRTLLEKADPDLADRLPEVDQQRLVRALAVLNFTGRPLSEWQRAGQSGLIEDWQTQRFVISPERDELRERIARRLYMMFAEGGVEEVRELLALDLDPSLPAMKAIGVREIGAMLRGELTRQEALDKAVTATHQYAKRQRTWARNHMADWQWRA